MYRVEIDDLTRPQVLHLLDLHLNGMRSNSPPESVFALDLTGLSSDDMTVWTAWDGPRLASIGALKMLDGGTAEVKSMRTDPDYLRKGAGSAILDTIIATAKARGLGRLSLETGSGEAFEPALALYRKRGFTDGAAFGDYRQSEFNQFLHLDLTADTEV